MEQLAKQRKKQHQMLINVLSSKVELIQKQKPLKTLGDREFFEINLMNMQDIALSDLGISESSNVNEFITR